MLTWITIHCGAPRRLLAEALRRRWKAGAQSFRSGVAPKLIVDVAIHVALPPKADMCGATSDVRFGPKADICSAKRHVRFTPESGHGACDSIARTAADNCSKSTAPANSAKPGRTASPNPHSDPR